MTHYFYILPYSCSLFPYKCLDLSLHPIVPVLYHNSCSFFTLITCCNPQNLLSPFSLLSLLCFLWIFHITSLCSFYLSPRITMPAKGKQHVRSGGRQLPSLLSHTSHHEKKQSSPASWGEDYSPQTPLSHFLLYLKGRIVATGGETSHCLSGID